LELQDIIVTPIILLLILVAAYVIRPYVTDSINRRYFFPALSLRIVGALALGLLYQFYYSGGDTFNYHTHGSRIVWQAFVDDPLTGLRLIFGGISDESGVYSYTKRILFFQDPASYFIIRIASFFDLFTFSTYSATAVLFAATSFAGGWAFFITFYNRYPHLHRPLAIGSLFIPSLFFWGSGILKDTIVLATLGFAVFLIDRIFIQRRGKFRHFILLLFCLFVIFVVKKFILQAFIPTAIIWVYFRHLLSIRSVLVRVLTFPLIFFLVSYGTYWIIVKVGEGDERYAVDRLAQTAKITAYDIGFYTGRDAGSKYSLGELDGTFMGMLQKAPIAINVTLFRPYIWEVRNPLMLLSAFESLLLTFLVIYVILKKRSLIFSSLRNPDVIFLLTFSMIIAFAVGITSYNFGTLSRYKIPAMPAFIIAMFLILNYSNSERKFDELEATE
jgi:hypothetical protein